MDNKYYNKDFYFSAFLLSKGCRLIEHSRNKGVTTFCFADENVAELALEYFSLLSRVEPISFGNALKTLKTIIHETDVNAGFNKNGQIKQRG